MFAEHKNYAAIANIIENYDQLPQHFKNSIPLLETSSKNNTIENKLIIEAKLDEWTIAAINDFQSRLRKIENLLPNNNPLIISSINKGSIIQTLIGEPTALITLITAFTGIGVAISMINKNITTTRKEELIIVKLENEIKYQEENLQNKLLLDKLEIKAKLNANEVTMAEILEKKRALKDKQDNLISKNTNTLIDMCLDQGFDVTSYLESQQGQSLKIELLKLQETTPVHKVTIVIEK